jgi:hypothetical protein
LSALSASISHLPHYQHIARVLRTDGCKWDFTWLASADYIAPAPLLLLLSTGR